MISEWRLLNNALNQFESLASLTLSKKADPVVAFFRPQFSPLDLLRGNYIGGITEAHRVSRPHILTHPIDNVEANVVADRDDGIFVETHLRDDGKYRVHITIADVAGHVPLQSSLAQTALARGFTVYGPGWTDPMFPKSLEEKLSLEHQQERLGFTISVDLDKYFKPQHMEFRPVITLAESMSYAQVAQRIQTDTQLQQMAQIATGLRKHFFSLDSKSASYFAEAADDDYHMSSNGWCSATEMVATYAVIGNHLMAKFFNQSHLDYVYRNFDSKDDEARAYYHTSYDGHDALHRDMGLSGAYGHFTSPIRRAADLLNAYMAHFAYDTLRSIEDEISHRFPLLEHTKIHAMLWEKGPQLLSVCSTKATNQKQQYIYEAENILLNFLEKQMNLESNLSRQVTKTIVHRLHHIKPPLSSVELERYVKHLNALMNVPETRALAKNTEAYQTLENIQPDSLSTMGKKAFSALLRRAATVGVISRPLYNEALARITSGKHDNIQDSFAILMLPTDPYVPRWNRLKYAILCSIKHDPSAVNGVLEQSRKFFGQNFLQEHSMNLLQRPNVDVFQQEQNAVCAAILILKHDGQASPVAARFYSVGHNFRAAISHARYAFLEHYAFGTLQPIEQTALPNVLYAELESNERSRRELVEVMTTQVGGKVSSHQYISSNGAGLRLEVSGGDFALPIIVDAEGDTAEAAERLAFRKLLHDTRFKHAVAPFLQVGSLMNPQYVLRDVARMQEYSLTFSPASSLQSGGFVTEILLTSGEMTRRFCGIGPNKDRALRSATVVALKALGQSLEGDSPNTFARSWATDNDEEQLRNQSRQFLMTGSYSDKMIQQRHLGLG